MSRSHTAAAVDTSTRYTYAKSEDGQPYRVRARPVLAAEPTSTPPQSSDDDAPPPQQAERDHAPKPGDYDVGYRKPPQHTRFRKGQSGNPKGRPKGSINIRTAMTNTLKGTMTVIENGRPTTLSRPEALARQGFNLALKGNAKFFQMFMEAAEQLEARLEAVQRQENEAAKVDPRDQELIDLFLAQMGVKPGNADGGDDGSAT